MNKVMNAITNKIIDLLRGRPALDIGGVSVWGDFTDDEKERLRHTLLDGQNTRERAKELDERIAELESIATEYAGKFQKAQDAAKHLIIMNDSAQVEIAHLKVMLATPVRLPDAYQTSCSESEKYLCPVEVAEAIRAAGFKCEGDDDNG